MKTNYDQLLPVSDDQIAANDAAWLEMANKVTMPPPNALYTPASRSMRRSLALDEGKIPDCTSGSSSAHLNAVAIKYLIANGGR